ncbi:MAG: DNA gyrase subunit A [bacterium]|nr:DNA gyrase subunit A [bacterium]
MTLGSVRQITIDQEMREAYLDYAMSVIVARALPDARDGLKPVHRRILYAMHDMGLRADTPYKKCARIVGEVLGKYHPHGDAAVYESLVRLAQDFSMRYELIDGQGNFGSVDGDGAAAMRYTEARMMRMGQELLTDIDRDTIDFVDNFDGTLEEPSVLPSAVPNLLVNGSSGIAVGMSTNIPPHNLGEVCDALVYMLQQWESLDDLTIRDLMQFIKGPDFPTGGLVYRHADSAADHDDDDSLVAAYATGRGKITMRARCHVEDMGRGKMRIIVSELPYQTNKSALIERIAYLVREGRIEGIADLRDESDRQGLRLAIELQRGVEAAPVLSALFRLTPLQETFSIIMLALVNGEPRTLSLKQALKVYLDHRLEVVRRRSEYDMKRARDRAHVLEGLLKALGSMDAVIQIIRGSRTADSARNNLIKALSIDEIQANAILEMQLRRLAALERKKIEEEHTEKIKLIAYHSSLLASPEKLRGVISDELLAMKKTYSDPRRTVILDSTATKVTDADLLTPQEDTWVTLTVDHKLGRTFDITAPDVADEAAEPLRFVLQSTTAQVLYLFSSQGYCATVPVQQVPQVSTPSDGTPYPDLSAYKGSEQRVTAAVALPSNIESGYLFFVTRGGEVKRLRMEDLPGMRADLFKVMDIESGDSLGWVFPTFGEQEVVLTTQQAQAIRFKESDVRPTGLGAGGMRGIKLSDETDQVVGAAPAEDLFVLLTVTDDGIAKHTPLSEYPTQGRAGMGVQTMKLSADSKGIAAAQVGRLDETVIVLTSHDRARPIRMDAAPSGKRASKGDYILSLNDQEQVTAVVRCQGLIVVPVDSIETAVAEPSL